MNTDSQYNTHVVSPESRVQSPDADLILREQTEPTEMFECGVQNGECGIPHSALPTPHSKRCPRILVIDDTRAIHDDFRKILANGNGDSASLGEAEAELFGEGYAKRSQNHFVLDSAYQGQEGLAMVERALQEGRRYEMAFVDVRMPPGLDGIETTSRLWEIDPDLQVVICTAYSDYSWEEMVEKIGGTDRLVILKKPFDTVEVLQLANALTEKWRLLQATRREMDELEELVSERTRHLIETNEQLQAEIALRKRQEQCLALQHDVTRVLADSTAASSEEITGTILKIICLSMNWDMGALWIVDRQANLLRCTTVWHPASTEFADFKAVSQQKIVRRGTGLPGRVWESGQPVWIADVTKDGNFPRVAVAVKAGLHTGFAFPLRLRGEVLGVVEFFSGKIRQPEDDMLQIFTTLGSLIGQSIERKKLEEQFRHAQKMEAVGHLAGGVAHDFNNILTVIQGYAQLLKLNTSLDSDTTDCLGQIALAAERAANLTRQLLTFSRKNIMQPKVLELNTVIGNLAKMLRRVIGEDIALHLDCSPDSTAMEADEDMLGQVLMNLTVNACDAMPAGGKLTISTQIITLDATAAKANLEARPGEFICLSVGDSGCGIQAELLAHIFEPFFTTKGVGQGTGLGLSTVHGIVKQHQGWIEVASQAGVGTTFRIFLPRAPHSAMPLKQSGSESSARGGTETILLVEDEGPVRKLARLILQRHGYRVLEANSGVEALLIWEKEADHIDLLLTDMVMPDGITGRDLAKKLRAQKRDLKIIYASGYSPNKGADDKNLLEGINFLQKPFHPHKLAQTIRDCLDEAVEKDVCVNGG